MNKVDFFLVGAAKSGTTALNDYLAQHPDVVMAHKKESHYFLSKEFYPGFKGPGDDGFNEAIVRDIEDYGRLFQSPIGQRLLGESSVWYLYYEQAAENIFQYNADARILVILRNPVERALSSYWYLRSQGRETEGFEEAINMEEARRSDNWEPIWHYYNAGRYAKMLTPYYQHFDRKQIKVIIYEEFKADPQKTLEDVYHFLQISQGFTPDMSIKPKISGQVSNKLLKPLVSNPGLKKLLKRIIPVKFWNRLKYKFVKKPDLSQPMKEMLKARYNQEVEELETLTGISFEIWKNA